MTAAEYPEHVQEAVQTIEEVREARLARLPRDERFVQNIVRRIGRPRSIVAVGVFIILWLSINAIFSAYRLPFDKPPFFWLDTIAQLFNVVIAIAILSAENTQSAVEEERSRLALQLAMIADRKITKALNDLEELRRAEPAIETPAHKKRDELQHETDLHQAAQLLREVEAENEQQPEKN